MALRKPTSLRTTRPLVVGGASVAADTVLTEAQVRSIRHLDAYLSNGWLKPNVDPYHRRQTSRPTPTSLNPQMVTGLLVSAASAPAAPTGLSATAGDAEVSVAFTPSVTDNTPVTNYEFSLDGGAWTAFSPADTSSPVTITGLVNDQEYSIRLRAQSALGPSPASAAVLATPVAEPEGGE